MDIDYSFLSIGGLYQTSIDVVRESCVRFGAKKAESVYLAAVDHIRNYGEKSLALEILNECGVEITDNDCTFLKKITEADGSIRYAKKY